MQTVSHASSGEKLAHYELRLRILGPHAAHGFRLSHEKSVIGVTNVGSII